MSRTTRKRVVTDAESRSCGVETGKVILLDISEESAYCPPSDVHETPEGVVIRMELPGVGGDSIDIRVRGTRIEVSGEKPTETAGEDASYLCLERCFGRFHRAFDVSGSVNLARMTAVLKEGVLTLLLPKILERRGRDRRVPIVSEEEK